jgi:hypothetical protein
MSTIALAVAAAVVCAPFSLRLSSAVLHGTAWKVPSQSILIAQKYAGSDPHGDDPHGCDPHDEQHDANLPANQAQDAQKAPKDEYGGTIPNSQSPH